MRKIMRDRAVGAAMASGLLIAAMALLGAGRYPVAFAAVGAAWVIVSAVAVVHAARRAD